MANKEIEKNDFDLGLEMPNDVEITEGEDLEEILEEMPVEVEECESAESQENVEEVPLEMSEEEMQIALDEEGSLDGTQEEVEELALEGKEETLECDTECGTELKEEPANEEHEETVEDAVEEVEAPEEDSEEYAEEEEEKVEEKPKKEEFSLTAPENLEEILANICTKRARKLIYRPSDVIFSHTTTVLGTDKNNDEKIKIKNILDAEIKQGVKLGYLDKFDGLKMSELKEEYENDIVYEYADQEFKRTGILLDGDKVKVYVYDWDMKACHHVGYIDDESVELVKPYIIDREKYSFDINGIIVGGKYKKITKDEKSGKITVEKGNDGNLGLEIDINIINRKD